MSRRDLSGALDLAVLQRFTLDDADLADEVLGLFQEQARLWGPMLDGSADGWRDAAHTLKGAARGIGANQLGAACETAETAGPGALPTVHAELDAALSDVAAYLHELALQSLRGARN